MKEPIRKLNVRRPVAATKPLRRVAAGLIVRGEAAAREVFICQRRADQPMGMKWEFPGGKIEAGETAEQALARELHEELGITAEVGAHITTVHHTYRNGGAIEIEFFRVDSFAGELFNHIFQQMLWAPMVMLPEYDFLSADLTLIRDLADGKLLN